MKKKCVHFRGQVNPFLGYAVRVYCGHHYRSVSATTNIWSRVTCGKCLLMRKFALGKIRVVYEEVK